MKLKTFLVMSAGLSLLASTTYALADDDKCTLSGKAVAPSQILKSVTSAGYTVDKDDEDAVKMDDCVYKVKAKDKADKKVKLYFDPINGKLIGKKED